MRHVDRRTLFQLGLGAAALGVVGCGAPSATPSHAPVSYAEWVAGRKTPFYIAHRGAGTTVPEHSAPGYQQALDWGADAMELSVVMSSDGVLYCHHDLALDRTTTLTGTAAQVPSSVLDTGRINIPRLGPAWSGANMPAIPRLEAVLDEVGGRAILCVEAKDFNAYEPTMALLQKRGLLSQVMVKTTYNSSRVAKAKQAGLPVFSYIGTIEEATADTIAKAAAPLGPTDALVLPARQGGGAFIGDDAIRAAVATGIPVWVYAVNRRSEVVRFAALGVSGFVTPCLGYLTGTVPVAVADTFASGRIAPGLTTRDPYSDWYGLGWGTAGAVELTGSDARYVCLGNLCPVARPESFRLSLEVSVPAGAVAATDAFEVAFGCRDDTYCPDGASGYAASLRGDGLLQLSTRSATGLTPLATPVQTAPLTPGQWAQVTVEVNGGHVSCTRDGSATVGADDTAWRGAYLHVGRAGGSARFAVRTVAVSAL